MQVSQITYCENELPPANPGEAGLLLHLLQHWLGWTRHIESTQHGHGRDWPPALGLAMQRCCRRQERTPRQGAWHGCKETRQAHMKQLWALQETKGLGHPGSGSSSVPQQLGTWNKSFTSCALSFHLCKRKSLD